jgi:hypothetical protein
MVSAGTRDSLADSMVHSLATHDRRILADVVQAATRSPGTFRRAHIALTLALAEERT